MLARGLDKCLAHRSRRRSRTAFVFAVARRAKRYRLEALCNHSPYHVRVATRSRKTDALDFSARRARKTLHAGWQGGRRDRPQRMHDTSSMV